MAIIDVWMQHPTLRFAQHDMFESLRRWTGQPKATTDVPLEATIAAMDEAGVDRGLAPGRPVKPVPQLRLVGRMPLTGPEVEPAEELPGHLLLGSPEP